MPARFRNDPATLMLAVFGDLHPDIDVVLEYRPAEQMPTPNSTALNDDDGRPDETGDLPAAGVTVFKVDGSEPPVIWLNVQLPVEFLPPVMAEELAHVVAGPHAQHGPAFQAIVDALQAEFERRAALLFEVPAVASTS